MPQASSQICNRCGMEKSLIEGFHKREKGRAGYNTICKECRKRHQKKYDPKRYRKNNLWATYGITEQEYESIWEKQGKVCGACKSNRSAGMGWNLDHDHETKKVRGILCHYCNMTLGNCKEDIRRLQACILYLRYHKKPEGFPPVLPGVAKRFAAVPAGGIGKCK